MDCHRIEGGRTSLWSAEQRVGSKSLKTALIDKDVLFLNLIREIN